MRRNVKNTKCCDENLIEHIKNTIPEIRITEKVVDDGHDVGGGYRDSMVSNDSDFTRGEHAIVRCTRL